MLRRTSSALALLTILSLIATSNATAQTYSSCVSGWYLSSSDCLPQFAGSNSASPPATTAGYYSTRGSTSQTGCPAGKHLSFISLVSLFPFYFLPTISLKFVNLMSLLYRLLLPCISDLHLWLWHTSYLRSWKILGWIYNILHDLRLWKIMSNGRSTGILFRGIFHHCNSIHMVLMCLVSSWLYMQR